MRIGLNGRSWNLGLGAPGDPSRGLAVHRRLLRWSRSLLGLLWAPLFWVGPAGDRLVRLLLPRSRPGDAGRPGAGRQPGRRRRGGHLPRACRRRSSSSAPQPLPCIGSLHERVRRPREPDPGARHGRPARAYHPGKFLNASFDKASDENERQSFQIRARQRPRDRPRADRRAGRAPDRRRSSRRVPACSRASGSA